MSSTLSKKYWQSLEEKQQAPQFIEASQHEFAEELPVEEFFGERAASLPLDRRDFLKLAGFSFSVAGLAACSKMPVEKAIPYLTQPEDVIPGVPNYYASTSNCPCACAIVVKTREGRPIKLEGNPASSINGQGLCAVGQAQVLGLYDSSRLKGPILEGKSTDWETLDNKVKAALIVAVGEKKKIRILTQSIVSPSTKKVIEKFSTKYPQTEHVMVDAISYSAIFKANGLSFGRQVIPHYQFDQAKVVVSIGADFLGTWLSPVEFSKNYAANRKLNQPNAGMSFHAQLEATMSLSGSNADLRVPLAASEYGKVLLDLYEALQGSESKNSSVKPETIHQLSKELLANKGSSLVLCGSNDIQDQIITNAINSLLGNYGKTIDLDHPSFQRQGDEAKFATLLEEMQKEEVGVLILYGVNPLYSSPQAQAFSEGLRKVTLAVISLDSYFNETSHQVAAIAPDHHQLESWGDAEPVQGYYSLIQPTIRPLFNTRAAQDSLLKWMGELQTYDVFLKNAWREGPYLRQSTHLNFEKFWQETLKQGVLQVALPSASAYAFRGNLAEAASKIKARSTSAEKLELVLYEKIAIRDGANANNPWLQELPDPISKITWDNYACLAPKLAKKLGYENEDLVKIQSGNQALELPVYIQPGQQENTVAVALGYGRSQAGSVGNGVGKNLFPWLNLVEGQWVTYAQGVSLTKVGKKYPLALTQTHSSLHGRPIVKEASFEEFQKNPAAGNEEHAHLLSLYPPRQDANQDQKVGHAWGMVIDLNACTGCGACVIACQAENNVAVVGKDEVRRRREMHWIRIDRYYSDSEDNPSVVHQPMTCQHCGNAPCETVCPVIATNHTSDGLNAQIYNRCVGTRYCANNCPYKVRRFNWFRYFDNDRFPYNQQDALGKMVLNPDVVVRSRGVMEKCSMCIQRIQAGKLDAKLAGQPLQDGQIKTACQQSCPTDAIVFGDINDHQSSVSRFKMSQRDYVVLEEVGTKPVVSYLTKIRNKA